MSKVKFTPEQQESLRNNKYTVYVTENTLSLSKEFKELFYREYQTGITPREILCKYGYPVEILGEQRIWGIGYSIKKEFAKNGCFRDVRTKASTASSSGSQEDRIRQLQSKVDYLTQEVEFLKKISSIRITRK